MTRVALAARGRGSLMRLLAAGAVSLLWACAPADVSAETHIIEMRGLEFSPASIDAKVGDTVTWINRDVMPHTATADDGSWDSGLMEEGDEWSLVIDDAGVLDYACTFHPAMTGVVNAD